MKNTSSSYNTKKTIALLVVDYLFALGGSVIGVIIGETIGSKQQKMSSDTQAYTYPEWARKHGKFISNTAAIIFYIGLLIGFLA
ncbi:MAG: hypothetical protein QMC70_06370 [Bacteroidia bacterium]|tara:strand:- start:1661 stop:1912 length:252 start_codon:yes stop_codon:yes gene_type:complete